MTGGFGTTSQSGSTGLFGKPITNFGTPATTTTNNFAFNSTPTTNLFGTNTQTKPFGSKSYYILKIHYKLYQYILFNNFYFNINHIIEKLKILDLCASDICNFISYLLTFY